MEDMLETLIKPRYFTERNEVCLFLEYLINCDENTHKVLSEDIKNNKVKTIIIQTFYSKNENMDYYPKLFEYIDKSLIEKLHIDYKFNDVLYNFKDLKHIGFNADKIKKININLFTNLETLVVTGYDDNFNNITLNDNIKQMAFWKYKKNYFDYTMEINRVEGLTFIHYSTLDISKLTCKYLKRLLIDKTKKLILNTNTLLNINYLNLCSCDTMWINNELISKLYKLEELWLEKCDLSFVDCDTFSLMPNLKVLVMDKCKNLKTIKGLSKLDRVVILDTQIEDNDTLPLLNSDSVSITNYKSYNKKF